MNGHDGGGGTFGGGESNTSYGSGVNNSPSASGASTADNLTSAQKKLIDSYANYASDTSETNKIWCGNCADTAYTKLKEIAEDTTLKSVPQLISNYAYLAGAKKLIDEILVLCDDFMRVDPKWGAGESPGKIEVSTAVQSQLTAIYNNIQTKKQAASDLLSLIK